MGPGLRGSRNVWGCEGQGGRVGEGRRERKARPESQEISSRPAPSREKNQDVGQREDLPRREPAQVAGGFSWLKKLEEGGAHELSRMLTGTLQGGRATPWDGWMPWNALQTEGAGRGGSDGLHVVGRQHARVPGALHRAVHPAVIDLLHVHDGVPVLEGHLILVGSAVVVHGAVPLPTPPGAPRWVETGAAGSL